MKNLSASWMRWTLVLGVAVGMSSSAWARTAGHSSHASGIGFQLGEPTGFTGKFWQGGNTAVQASLSYSFSSFFMITTDYLWHFEGAFGNATPFAQEIQPYLGIGGAVFFSTKSNRRDGRFFTTDGSSTGFGVRLPAGVEWLVPRGPFGIYIELVPGVGLIPETFSFLQGGIGAHYYF